MLLCYLIFSGGRPHSCTDGNGVPVVVPVPQLKRGGEQQFKRGAAADAGTVVFAAPATAYQQVDCSSGDKRMSARIVMDSVVVMNPSGVEGDYCVGCRGGEVEEGGGGDNRKSELNTLLETRNGSRKPNHVIIVPMSSSSKEGGGGGGHRVQADLDRGDVKLWKSHGK